MIERIVGRFGGFELGMLAARGEEHTQPVPVRSVHVQRRAVSNRTGPGRGLDGVRWSRCRKHHTDAVDRSWKLRRKRLEDIQLELARSVRA
jgi:hypothetical protein